MVSQERFYCTCTRVLHILFIRTYSQCISLHWQNKIKRKVTGKLFCGVTVTFHQEKVLCTRWTCSVIITRYMYSIQWQKFKNKVPGHPDKQNGKMCWVLIKIPVNNMCFLSSAEKHQPVNILFTEAHCKIIACFCHRGEGGRGLYRPPPWCGQILCLFWDCNCHICIYSFLLPKLRLPLFNVTKMSWQLKCRRRELLCPFALWELLEGREFPCLLVVYWIVL